MSQGRKPLPTAIKVAKGNPGKRPLNADEPKVAARLPACPVHLIGEARSEWNRTGKRLLRSGLISDLDTAAFAAYCQAWARWVEAEDKLRATGAVIKAPSGYPIQNPYLAIANKAIEQMKSFLTEFGMTPSSRSRVGRTGEPGAYEDQDPAEEFFGKPRLVKPA